MTSSAYFMSKSVFVVQGCRALTFALARLSCIYQVSTHFTTLPSGNAFHYIKISFDVMGSITFEAEM